MQHKINLFWSVKTCKVCFFQLVYSDSSRLVLQDRGYTCHERWNQAAGCLTDGTS